MHVVFFHKNFPGQFGHVARRLVRQGFECTFACERPPYVAGGVPVRYTADFAAGAQVAVPDTRETVLAYQFSFVAQAPAATAPTAEEIVDGIRILRYPAPVSDAVGYDGQIAHGHDVYQFLKERFPLRPDVAVSNGVYGSTPFLSELYGCPVVHCFDYYYRPTESYLHFRPEFPAEDIDRFRARAYNAFVLLDLESCAAGYSPTEWQRALLPTAYRHKVETIFDGVDREFWRRRPAERRIGNFPPIAPDTRIVTYAARGLEALRGFDVFMKTAQRIAEVRKDVVFVVVGAEDFYHGPDLRYIRERSFAEHVIRQGRYGLSRFLFTGRVSAEELARIFSLSDLHVYLTAPFVLSWSLFDALACGCTVLGSDTAPVREVIRHEETGLLAGFFDVDGLARQALRVLDEPARFRALGEAGARLIDEKYSLERTVPRMVDLLQRVVRSARPGPSGASG
jgi:glycosyltransferase involved in cell wall biosynthesis